MITERKAVGLEVQEQMVVAGAARAQPSPYRNQGPLWSENVVRNEVTCLETELERTGMCTRLDINQAVRTGAGKEKNGGQACIPKIEYKED